jgi:hypothetical protein
VPPLQYTIVRFYEDMFSGSRAYISVKIDGWKGVNSVSAPQRPEGA